MPLNSKKRYREIVQVRMVYCFIARMMGHSLVKIARSLSRDHSTIIHNIDTFKNLMETNPQFIEFYKEIFQHVKQKLENYDPKLLECSNQTQDNDEPALLS
jgi:chromosomal replication initiation ATPase DnaA